MNNTSVTVILILLISWVLLVTHPIFKTIQNAAVG